MTICTYGTRDWHPSEPCDANCLIALNAELILDDIKHGRCPRCWGPLLARFESPIGSRITSDRSIPICGKCSRDEINEMLDGLSISTAGAWPIPEEAIEDRRRRHPHWAQA